ncbi:succinylglutamate desuccinylase/aspartoacylase family protein [Yersinia kristensenii]|uniref:succinylglutamate desuccinylase/aspartoacylase family protein n=1 Tax=Yersinia kristensenii TaxID=28152 RepID=UPI000E04A5D4|nr:succinylglutamate desuccinylase/aspartoacylase family protein [Yersinia kristensenii]SUP70475.1 ectoine utilization protein EutE [Yersinia kristensenii]
MSIHSSYSKHTIGQAGILSWGQLSFDHPTLAGLELPYFDIEALQPGPKLAIIAGMHPNEVSAMEAALRLKDYFATQLVRGSVTILPVLNMPGLYLHSEFVCPEDNKNINFLSPGDPQGSFSEVLIDSVLNSWAKDAAVFIDLHGGDLREEVAKFVMCQQIGDVEFDLITRSLAHQFDADAIVEFAVDQTNNRGRATNELPWLGRHAVMSEGGANGILDDENTQFHFNGVANIARHLGLTQDPVQTRTRLNIVVNNFDKIEAPFSGRLYLDIVAGEQVTSGQRLGVIKNLYGEWMADVIAPFSGLILMIVNHNIINQGEWLISLAPLPLGLPE